MDVKTIDVKKDILNANKKTAEKIRATLDKYHCRMINIMSSPGSGKTSLITRTINHFKDVYNIAVIEGDIASSIDTEKISELNVPALQINTGGGCHLDANMIEKALKSLTPEHLDIVFIENVGNLVCTADFDLGAHKNVVILSIPEGDDKPYKYPVIFMEADIVLVNKIDVRPYFDFALETFPEIVNGLNPSAAVLPVSTKSGDGLDEWFLWIEQILRAHSKIRLENNMAFDPVYKELSDNLGVWESERFLKILKATFTPVEAKICIELFEPATCPELAERLGMDEKDLQKTLDVLVDKGMLTRGLTQYAFHTTLLAFHHECCADVAPHTGPYAMTKEQKDLWKDFFYNEWCHEFMKHIEEMIEALGKNLPISPSILALELSPNIKPEDILPEENFKQKIIDAKRRILSPCGCRISWGHECEKPRMTCFSAFDRPRGEYYLNQPGRLLKEVSLEEALETARDAERAGLVHWGDCYCCDTCCENLFPIRQSKRYDLMTPNRFAAVVDEEKCNGCKKCEKRCYFEAIEFKKDPENPKRVKAAVIPENCKGCGLCIITCKPNALRYEIVRPPEYLKPKPLEEGKEPPPFPVWGHYFLK